MERLKRVGCFFMSLLCGWLLFPVQAESAPLSFPVEISREEKTLELEDVTEILTVCFQALYPEAKYRIVIKTVSSFEKIKLPPGRLSCDIVLSDPARRGGDISLLFLFRMDGREVGKTRVNARVDVLVDAVVTAHFLGRHHGIQPKDIQRVSRSLALLPPDFLTDTEGVFGKRTVIAVNRGEVLRAGMIEEPPLIRRGDRVMLFIENEQIRITTAGEAREEGRRGERIKLVNLSSKREVSGRILDEKKVQVDF